MNTEFEAEAAHLKEVQKSIRKESDQLMENLAAMKKWKDENRKEELSERAIADRMQTRMLDAGITDNRYTQTYERVLELSKMYDAPYFGKIVFSEKNYEDEEAYYIGKRGLTDGMDPLILDWRTPIASLFYQQRLGDMSFEAPAGTIEVELRQRRQFMIKNGELQGMFDSAVDVQDEILQKMLSENSTDRLREIVATIQKEQDDIIRAPFEENIFLDGVAGSGKTTIILHRVAYLLFNYRAKLHNNILILGPNQIFMEYISQVLPDLGETEGTHQRTLKSLANELLDLRGKVMETADYYEKLLQKEGRNADAFRREVYHRASAAFAAELDQALNTFENAQRRSENLVFDGNLLLSKEEGNDLFFHTWHSMPYNRRIMRIKRLINDRLRRARNHTVQEIRLNFKNRIASANEHGELALSNKLKDQLEKEIRNYLIRINDFRMQLRQVYPLLDAECWYAAFLQGKPAVMLSEEESASCVWVEEDLWAMLYAQSRVEGAGLFEVRHLLVDEAQDVSELGLLTLQKLTGTQSMTIVGDIRQKIKGRDYPSLMDSWRKLLPQAVSKRTRECRLTMSYRSTHEIMEYAAASLDASMKVKMQTVNRPGAEVRSASLPGILGEKQQGKLRTLLLEEIDALRAEKMERIAILTENLEQARKIAALVPIETEVILGEKQHIHAGKIPILPVYFAKGLEYDGVIALDTKKDQLIHYVLCTRALHRLTHIEI